MGHLMEAKGQVLPGGIAGFLAFQKKRHLFQFGEVDFRNQLQGRLHQILLPGLVIGVRQNAYRIVFDRVVMGGGNQGFADGDDLFAPLGYLQGIEQIVQNNIISGILFQPFPKHFLRFFRFPDTKLRRFHAQSGDLFFHSQAIVLEKVVGGYPKKRSDGRNQCDVRKSGAGFPFADSLKAYPQHLGQYLLRYVFLLPELADFFTHVDVHLYRLLFLYHSTGAGK